MRLIFEHGWTKGVAQVTLDDIQAVVSGDREALVSFVDEITPVVHARVAKRLLQMSLLSRGRSIRQDVEDFVQEVFVVLFENNAKVLRTWSPEKGLSLKNYVGLVTERHVGAVLRTAKRSPWTESPTVEEKLESHIVKDAPGSDHAGLSHDGNPEAAVRDREIFYLTLQDLEGKLSPLGKQMFQAIVVKDKPVDEICREFHMGSDAVYAWRSRLIRRARESFEKIMSEKSPSRTKPEQVGHD